MGRIAFVFSGQGDQYAGMGKDLFERYETARKVFLQCEDIRKGTMEQCFDGTEEELRETKNTQPCLFAMEYAASSVLLDKGIRPHAVAGFSLGEVAAATVSGVFDLETGFRLVCKRGELMQSAAEKHETSMAAVVRLTPEVINELCAGFGDVYPVNFNCPGQITVSGRTDQMADFSVRVKEAGGRAIPLKVKGAFHSPFMREAAERFSTELGNADINLPAVTLYSNATAEPYTDDVVGLLSRQICSPVMWEQIIRNMTDAGIDTFVEIGPGKTLCNMIKKINDQVNTYSISDMEQIFTEMGVC